MNKRTWWNLLEVEQKITEETEKWDAVERVLTGAV